MCQNRTGLAHRVHTGQGEDAMGSSTSTALDGGPEALISGLPDRALPGPCLPPMLATLGSMPVHPEQFGYEVKWDGYRLLARFDGRHLMLCSRNGIDLSPRFPEITALGQALHRPVLLDGELVALDREGRPRFSALQTRMPHPGGVRGARHWDPREHSVHYMVFDVLHYGHKPVTRLPYADRRSLLESFALAGPAWQTPPFHSDGAALLDLMRRNHQEGIIAKRYTSIYQAGRRSPDWIKVKVSHSDEFVVVGWWSSGKHGMSSLLLGYHPSNASAAAGAPLLYCGKVGTGFSDADRVRLERALKRLAVATPPVTGDLPRGPGISWCRPALVAQIRYSEWTHDGSLRHPTYLGLRSDKLPGDVVHRPGGGP
jgi:bifunctional non-homologous end joining protein LigD